MQPFNRLVDYAINFLMANWDEDTENDLGMSETEAVACFLEYSDQRAKAKESEETGPAS